MMRLDSHRIVQHARLMQAPASLLRADLKKRRLVPYSELRRARDGRRVKVAGLVLVRQKAGSANGVLFITLEDETGVANLIVWPSLFVGQRQVVTSAAMLACRRRVQREGDLIHLIAEQLVDPSDLLRSVGERDKPVLLPLGRKPWHI
jgi:error-prone DNA polymerase